MARNFRLTRSFVILALGTFFSLEVCPNARAQQPADGSPQTAPQNQGAPVTAPNPQSAPQTAQPPNTAQTPKPAPKKRSILPAKSKKKAPAKPVVDASAEPDKILYDRALADLKAGRYTEGRLALQTLINTYPDSEYLAKAKLSVADSYYKEGGTSSTLQAISEYKDFGTFFPFLDEAAYAQMQIGMAHYRMMEKADRDSTQAQAAEDEFQAFILRYPQSPLLPRAEQYLREVQEVLGDGEFKIARYYYVKADYRAAAARLVEVSDRYPLYSQTDEALWMLANVYYRAKQVSKNEDDKNHWGDLSAKCYDRILRDYPLSKRAVDARARLVSMGLPAPSADPEAYARMTKEQLYREQHHQSAIIRTPLSMIKGNPDVTYAAHAGTPQMSPPTDSISATDILKPGARGPAFTVSGTDATPTGPDQPADAAPVDATTAPKGASSTPGNSLGFEIIAAPTDPNAVANAPAPAAENPAAPSAGPTLAPSNNVPVLTPTAPTSVGPGTSANPSPGSDGSPIGSTAAAPPAGGESTSTAPPAAGAAPAAKSAQPKTEAAKSDPADPKEESTSKKKKGVKKLIPW